MKYHKYLFTVLTAWMLASCTQSPSGSVTELIVTRPPTLSGQSSRVYTTAATTYDFDGECDPISYGIEWSLNGGPWNAITDGCPNGTFHISISLSQEARVLIRAKTKTGYTSSAVATVRFVLPPNSPFMKFASSGRADNEFVGGSQNEVSDTSAKTLTNGAIILKSSMADMIYEH